MSNEKKCGYVAILGCPNAGKSTLLNALIGKKIAIVSNKPQTTRNKILGIYTENNSQALFYDTPGIHKSMGLPRINSLMNKIAHSVLYDASLVCYLIDITRGWTDEDTLWLSGIVKNYQNKLLLLVTKSDKLKNSEIQQQLPKITESFNNFLLNAKPACQLVTMEPWVVSSKQPEAVNLLRDMILRNLPNSEWLYAEDDLTDQPQKFVCAELIREQVFRQLGQELPYKIAVVVDVFATKKDLVRIVSSIIVEKPSYKGMVIGKGGERLKSIGIAARLSLEKHLEKKVFLELFVKIKSGWTENTNMLLEFSNMQSPDLAPKFLGDVQ